MPKQNWSCVYCGESYNSESHALDCEAKCKLLLSLHHDINNIEDISFASYSIEQHVKNIISACNDWLEPRTNK